MRRWFLIALVGAVSEGETIMVLSMKDLIGFDILATDGELGDVEEF